MISTSFSICVYSLLIFVLFWSPDNWTCCVQSNIEKRTSPIYTRFLKSTSLNREDWEEVISAICCSSRTGTGNDSNLVGRKRGDGGNRRVRSISTRKSRLFSCHRCHRRRRSLYPAQEQATDQVGLALANLGVAGSCR